MRKNLALALVALLALTSIVSAQTLIVGKIYNSDFSATISGADVSINCNGEVLDTNSISDGTYAVRFNDSLCAAGDSFSVSASKDTATGSDSGVVNPGTDEDKGIVNVAITVPAPNIPVSPSSGGGGGSGGHYYFCGNGICDTGENSVTCPKDCPVEILATSEENETETTSEAPEEQPTQGFFAGITGAVVGVFGTTGSIFAIIFVVLILGAGITVYVVRVRARKKEE